MILLDTHTIVWIATDKRKLSPDAADAIREQSREAKGIYVSGFSLWEIAMMSRKGRMRLPGTLTEFLSYVESAFIVLPITGAIAERSMLFSEGFPADPADRLIAATAVTHNLSLVTKDWPLRRSEEVECIW